MPERTRDRADATGCQVADSSLATQLGTCWNACTGRLTLTDGYDNAAQCLGAERTAPDANTTQQTQLERNSTGDAGTLLVGEPLTHTLYN